MVVNLIIDFSACDRLVGRLESTSDKNMSISATV